MNAIITKLRKIGLSIEEGMANFEKQNQENYKTYNENGAWVGEPTPGANFKKIKEACASDHLYKSGEIQFHRLIKMK